MHYIILIKGGVHSWCCSVGFGVTDRKSSGTLIMLGSVDTTFCCFNVQMKNTLMSKILRANTYKVTYLHVCCPVINAKGTIFL